MKNISGFIALYLISSYVTAMSFAGLTHEIHFEPHSAQISMAEIHSFMDWQSEKNSQFSGGEYDVFLIKNNVMEVTDALVKKRAAAIVQLMKNVGIEVDVSVEQRFNKVKYQELIDRLNSAVIAIQPPCTKTHSCGPQPIYP